MKKLENENFNDLISKGLYLVDFYAEWCGPCKMLAPVLESITEIDIIKVDVDIHNDLAMKYRIMSVPTLMFFKDGNLIKEISGFHSKDELIKIISDLNRL